MEYQTIVHSTISLIIGKEREKGWGRRNERNKDGERGRMAR